MKKFILYFLVFMSVSGPLFANYPYYFFEEKKIRISSANFNRYIIPQTIAIVKEYYHVLRKLNPLHSEIVDLKDKVELLRYTYAKRRRDCYKTPGLCMKELTDLHKVAIDVDNLLLKLKQRHGNFKKKGLQTFTDELLIVSHMTSKISSYNYSLLHMIEEQILVLNTRYEIYSSSKKKMNELILKIVTNTQMIITAFVPPEYKQEFDFLWMNFVTNLEKYIIRDKNPKYLIKHLGELNISWNSFHMKLSKGNLNFPRKLLKIISIQHNRWNSILKVILRR